MSIPVIQSAAIELTNLCQNTCSICHAHNKGAVSPGSGVTPPRPLGCMDLSIFKELVYQLLEQTRFRKGELRIAPSYAGESMLHPFYGSAVQFLKSKPEITPMIYTNGLLLDKHLGVLEDLTVNISLHSQGFEKTVQNIKLYSNTFGKRALVHIVHGDLTPAQQDEAVNKLWAFADVYIHPFISESLQVTPQIPGRCTNPSNYLGILWDGRTLPCCHLLDPGLSFSMGNAIQEGVLGVWEGAKYEALRAGKLHGLPCDYCKVYQAVHRAP